MSSTAQPDLTLIKNFLNDKREQLIETYGESFYNDLESQYEVFCNENNEIYELLCNVINSGIEFEYDSQELGVEESKEFRNTKITSHAFLCFLRCLHFNNSRLRKWLLKDAENIMFFDKFFNEFSSLTPEFNFWLHKNIRLELFKFYRSSRIFLQDNQNKKFLSLFIIFAYTAPTYFKEYDLSDLVTALTLVFTPEPDSNIVELSGFSRIVKMFETGDTASVLAQIDESGVFELLKSSFDSVILYNKRKTLFNKAKYDECKFNKFYEHTYNYPFWDNDDAVAKLYKIYCLCDLHFEGCERALLCFQILAFSTQIYYSEEYGEYFFSNITNVVSVAKHGFAFEFKELEQLFENVSNEQLAALISSGSINEIREFLSPAVDISINKAIKQKYAVQAKKGYYFGSFSDCTVGCLFWLDHHLTDLVFKAYCSYTVSIYDYPRTNSVFQILAKCAHIFAKKDCEFCYISDIFESIITCDKFASASHPSPFQQLRNLSDDDIQTLLASKSPEEIYDSFKPDIDNAVEYSKRKAEFSKVSDSEYRDFYSDVAECDIWSNKEVYLEMQKLHKLSGLVGSNSSCQRRLCVFRLLARCVCCFVAKGYDIGVISQVFSSIIDANTLDDPCDSNCLQIFKGWSEDRLKTFVKDENSEEIFTFLQLTVDEDIECKRRRALVSNARESRFKDFCRDAGKYIEWLDNGVASELQKLHESNSLFGDNRCYERKLYVFQLIAKCADTFVNKRYGVKVLFPIFNSFIEKNANDSSYPIGVQLFSGWSNSRILEFIEDKNSEEIFTFLQSSVDENIERTRRRTLVSNASESLFKDFCRDAGKYIKWLDNGVANELQKLHESNSLFGDNKYRERTLYIFQLIAKCADVFVDEKYNVKMLLPIFNSFIEKNTNNSSGSAGILLFSGWSNLQILNYCEKNDSRTIFEFMKPYVDDNVKYEEKRKLISNASSDFYEFCDAIGDCDIWETSNLPNDVYALYKKIGSYLDPIVFRFIVMNFDSLKGRIGPGTLDAIFQDEIIKECFEGVGNSRILNLIKCFEETAREYLFVFFQSILDAPQRKIIVDASVWSHNFNSFYHLTCTYSFWENKDTTVKLFENFCNETIYSESIGSKKALLFQLTAVAINAFDERYSTDQLLRIFRLFLTGPNFTSYVKATGIPEFVDHFTNENMISLINSIKPEEIRKILEPVVKSVVELDQREKLFSNAGNKDEFYKFYACTCAYPIWSDENAVVEMFELFRHEQIYSIYTEEKKKLLFQLIAKSVCLFDKAYDKSELFSVIGQFLNCSSCRCNTGYDSFLQLYANTTKEKLLALVESGTPEEICSFFEPSIKTAIEYDRKDIERKNFLGEEKKLRDEREKLLSGESGCYCFDKFYRITSNCSFWLIKGMPAKLCRLYCSCSVYYSTAKDKCLFSAFSMLIQVNDAAYSSDVLFDIVADIFNNKKLNKVFRIIGYDAEDTLLQLVKTGNVDQIREILAPFIENSIERTKLNKLVPDATSDFDSFYDFTADSRIWAIDGMPAKIYKLYQLCKDPFSLNALKLIIMDIDVIDEEHGINNLVFVFKGAPVEECFDCFKDINVLEKHNGEEIGKARELLKNSIESILRYKTCGPSAPGVYKYEYLEFCKITSGYSFWCNESYVDKLYKLYSNIPHDKKKFEVFKLLVRCAHLIPNDNVLQLIIDSFKDIDEHGFSFTDKEKDLHSVIQRTCKLSFFAKAENMHPMEIYQSLIEPVSHVVHVNLNSAGCQTVDVSLCVQQIEFADTMNIYTESEVLTLAQKGYGRNEILFILLAGIDFEIPEYQLDGFRTFLTVMMNAIGDGSFYSLEDLKFLYRMYQFYKDDFKTFDNALVRDYSIYVTLLPQLKADLRIKDPYAVIRKLMALSHGAGKDTEDGFDIDLNKIRVINEQKTALLQHAPLTASSQEKSQYLFERSQSVIKLLSDAENKGRKRNSRLVLCHNIETLGSEELIYYVSEYLYEKLTEFGVPSRIAINNLRKIIVNGDDSYGKFVNQLRSVFPKVLNNDTKSMEELEEACANLRSSCYGNTNWVVLLVDSIIEILSNLIGKKQHALQLKRDFLLIKRSLVSLKIDEERSGIMLNMNFEGLLQVSKIVPDMPNTLTTGQQNTTELPGVTLPIQKVLPLGHNKEKTVQNNVSNEQIGINVLAQDERVLTSNNNVHRSFEIPVSGESDLALTKFPLSRAQGSAQNTSDLLRNPDGKLCNISDEKKTPLSSCAGQR